MRKICKNEELNNSEKEKDKKNKNREIKIDKKKNINIDNSYIKAIKSLELMIIKKK